MRISNGKAASRQLHQRSRLARLSLLIRQTNRIVPGFPSSGSSSATSMAARFPLPCFPSFGELTRSYKVDWFSSCCFNPARHSANRCTPVSLTTVQLLLTPSWTLVRMCILRSCSRGDENVVHLDASRVRVGAPPSRRGLHVFTAAGSRATYRPFWHWHPPQNTRHLRVFGGLNTNTRSPPNSIPCGQPGLWRLLVTKGEQSCY